MSTFTTMHSSPRTGRRPPWSGSVNAATRLRRGLPLLPARVGGLLLGAALGLTAVVRRAKPLHTVGAVTAATWSVTQPASLGVPLLDSRGQQRVLVRLSRAVSLTRVGWDVMGLAVRVPHAAADGQDADLLFSTTGTGRWTRFLLVPRPRWGVGDYSTLLPLAWQRGTATLRLHARSITAYDLSVSTRANGVRRRSPWKPVGQLVLDRTPTTDEPLRFRPVAAPAGLAAPAWVTALRQPAYVAARRLARS
ncbi:MAG: phosphodiesterase [Actinobacteria bacterium]|nr:phosphodiesterase [Actinomycetota bacterium]